MPSKTTVICPETGKELNIRGHQIEKHIRTVWGVDVTKTWTLENADAVDRIEFLLDARAEEGS